MAAWIRKGKKSVLSGESVLSQEDVPAKSKASVPPKGGGVLPRD